jgi:hypothetical protein
VSNCCCGCTRQEVNSTSSSSSSSSISTFEHCQGMQYGRSMLAAAAYSKGPQVWLRCTPCTTASCRLQPSHCLQCSIMLTPHMPPALAAAPLQVHWRLAGDGGAAASTCVSSAGRHLRAAPHPSPQVPVPAHLGHPGSLCCCHPDGGRLGTRACGGTAPRVHPLCTWPRPQRHRVGSSAAGAGQGGQR